MDDQGVPSDSPADKPQDTQGAQGAQGDAGDTVRPGDDRPIQNVVAEFNRKHAKTQQQLDAVLAYLQQAHQSQQAAMQSQQQGVGDKPLTDEDLWAEAQKGNRQAFELYQQRIADRRLSTHFAQRDQAGLTASQLNALWAKYPVLNDPTHALTQSVNAAYQLLVQRGYAAGPDTLLRGAMTAIADRPDLVSELYDHSVASNTARRSATQTAQAGQTGASVRETRDSRQPSTRALSDEEQRLAQRMGVKDPAKAKERWTKRYEEGRSQLGAIGAVLGEETGHER